MTIVALMRELPQEPDVRHCGTDSSTSSWDFVRVAASLPLTGKLERRRPRRREHLRPRSRRSGIPAG